jgi:hypothetical protein
MSPPTESKIKSTPLPLWRPLLFEPSQILYNLLIHLRPMIWQQASFSTLLAVAIILPAPICFAI